MGLFKIVVWAIIFLTKLRFPPGISITIVFIVNQWRGSKSKKNSDEISNFLIEFDFGQKCCLNKFKNFSETTLTPKTILKYLCEMLLTRIVGHVFSHNHKILPLKY